MDRKERKAVIDGVEYTLDSDNAPLLEKLEKVKYNKDTKNYEDAPYLPISVIYQLLEQFYPDYSLESRPLEKEGSYVIKKNKYNYDTKQKEAIEEEVILFKKSIKLSLGDRTIEGEARSVATIGQISLDQTYNGFASKCEARALKNGTKKLGKIFRISNDREETMERESIKDDLSITDIVKNIGSATLEKKSEAPSGTPTGEIEDKMFDIIDKDYRDMVVEWKQANEGKAITIVDIQQMGVKLREKHGFKKGETADETMKKIYNKLKEELGL